jgi:hypothetical protein
MQKDQRRMPSARCPFMRESFFAHNRLAAFAAFGRAYRNVAASLGSANPSLVEPEFKQFCLPLHAQGDCCLQ